MDHIDQQSADLADRERPHVANHIRSIQVQTLDALLRIEEMFSKALVDLGTGKLIMQPEKKTRK